MTKMAICKTGALVNSIWTSIKMSKENYAIDELIVYSAKAIGLEGKWLDNEYLVEKDGKFEVWNPLESNSNCIDLMIEKDISIQGMIKQNKQIGFFGHDFKVVYKTELQKKEKYRYLVTLISANYYAKRFK